jgi:hypothetical protein
MGGSAVMPEQRLHSALAPIDVLTRIELEEVLHKGLDAAIRDSVRGKDVMRFPTITLAATAATQNIGAVGNDMSPCGPEQGDIWMLRRVIVKSSSFTDTAKYLIFRGSTPSDSANSYTSRFLLDAINGGATPGLNVNVGFYVSTKSVFLQPGEQIYAQILGATVGNAYTLDGEAIRVPAEMKGKLL